MSIPAESGPGGQDAPADPGAGASGTADRPRVGPDEPDRPMSDDDPGAAGADPADVGPGG